MVRRIGALYKQATASFFDLPGDAPVRWGQLVRPAIVVLAAPGFLALAFWGAVDPPNGSWPLRLILPACGLLAMPVIVFSVRFVRSELRRGVGQHRQRQIHENEILGRGRPPKPR